MTSRITPEKLRVHLFSLLGSEVNKRAVLRVMPALVIVAAILLHVAGKESPAAMNRAAELFHGAMWGSSLTVVISTVIIITSMLTHPRIIN